MEAGQEVKTGEPIRLAYPVESRLNRRDRISVSSAQVIEGTEIDNQTKLIGPCLLHKHWSRVEVTRRTSQVACRHLFLNKRLQSCLSLPPVWLPLRLRWCNRAIVDRGRVNMALHSVRVAWLASEDSESSLQHLA